MSSKLEKDARYEAGVPAFFKRQLSTHPPPTDPSFKLPERGAIVTGANGGLGYEAARQFCQLGIGHLIITARSKGKGDAAVAKLRAEYPDISIELEMLDMDSYDSIQAFVGRIAEKEKRVDLALLNAGIQMGSFVKNAQTGHETSLQVNYLSTALLSVLLLPVLKKNRKAGGGPVPVLSIVASDTSYMATFKDPKGSLITPFDDEKQFSRMGNYSKSKFLDVMLAQMLAERVRETDVVVNSSNPGLTKGTSLAGDTIVVRMLGLLAAGVARTTAVGASALVDAVVRGEGRHGSYVSEWTEKPFPAILYGKDGDAMRERLWGETVKELEFAGVTKILEEL